VHVSVARLSGGTRLPVGRPELRYDTEVRRGHRKAGGQARCPARRIFRAAIEQPDRLLVVQVAKHISGAVVALRLVCTAADDACVSAKLLVVARSAWQPKRLGNDPVKAAGAGLHLRGARVHYRQIGQCE